MVLPIVSAGTRAGLPMVLKLAKNKMIQTGLLTAGAMETYDIVTGLFDKDNGELGNTDPQTADEMIKTSMAILEELEQGGIPLNGLKNSKGEPLETNYIVIDIEKNRVFPIHKYRSKKTVQSARRRARSRGYGRARRQYRVYP